MTAYSDTSERTYKKMYKTTGLPMKQSITQSMAKSAMSAAVFLGATILGTSMSVCAVAQTNVAAPDAPPPMTAEDLARAINEDTQTPPTSRTRTTDGVVTEYREGGRTYLIQVDPQAGSRYYVIDIDGDGTPESYRENAEADVNIGKWKIGSW